MPTDRVRIFHVTSAETTTPGVRLFVVTSTRVDRPTICVQLETVDAYAASICQRAKELDRAVAVTWSPTQYGRTLIAAQLIEDVSLVDV